MMNVCLKCRAFYDDEQLRFCLADGAPLVAVAGNDSSWEIGQSALRVVKQVARRKTEMHWIKQLIWTLVTTIIVVSVIYVVVMNIWIYLGGPGKYFVKNAEESIPTPTPVIEFVMEVETATLQPTATPTLILLNPTPTPSRCNIEQQRQILRSNIAELRSEIQNEEGRIKEKWVRQPGAVQQQIEAVLELGNVTVNVGEDCRRASINVPYTWSLRFIPSGRRTIERGIRSLNCRNDNRWSCR